jgi:hypothetical protein
VCPQLALDNGLREPPRGSCPAGPLSHHKSHNSCLRYTADCSHNRHKVRHYRDSLYLDFRFYTWTKFFNDYYYSYYYLATAAQYTFTHKQYTQYSSTAHIYTQTIHTIQQYSTHLHTNSTHNTAVQHTFTHKQYSTHLHTNSTHNTAVQYTFTHKQYTQYSSTAHVYTQTVHRIHRTEHT